MNTSPSTMIADPVIRIPAWRIASPMNLKTRRFRTFHTIRPQKRDASPNAISAAIGLVSTFIAAYSGPDG